MACCELLLEERRRKILAYILMVSEIALVCVHIFAFSLHAFISSDMSKIKPNHKKSYSKGTEVYIFIIIGQSVLFHFIAIKLWRDSANWRLRRRLKYVIPCYAIFRFGSVVLLLSVAFAAHIQYNRIKRISKTLNTESVQKLWVMEQTGELVEVDPEPVYVPEDYQPPEQEMTPVEEEDKQQRDQVEINSGEPKRNTAGFWLKDLLYFSVLFECIYLMAIRIFERSSWHALSWGDPTQLSQGYLCVICGNEPVPPNPKVREDSDSDEPNEYMDDDMIIVKQSLQSLLSGSQQSGGLAELGTMQEHWANVGGLEGLKSFFKSKKKDDKEDSKKKKDKKNTKEKKGSKNNERGRSKSKDKSKENKKSKSRSKSGKDKSKSRSRSPGKKKGSRSPSKGRKAKSKSPGRGGGRKKGKR